MLLSMYAPCHLPAAYCLQRTSIFEMSLQIPSQMPSRGPSWGLFLIEDLLPVFWSQCTLRLIAICVALMIRICQSW